MSGEANTRTLAKEPKHAGVISSPLLSVSMLHLAKSTQKLGDLHAQRPETEAVFDQLPLNAGWDRLKPKEKRGERLK